MGSFPISNLHQQVKDKTSDETNKVKELRLLRLGINVDYKTGRILAYSSTREQSNKERG